MSDIEHELVRLEREGWNSLCDGTAGDFYSTVMTDEAVMVLANGMVMDRESVVEALSGPPSWASFALDDVRVVPIGADSAALIYRAEALRTAGGEPFIGIMTSIYVMHGDTWRLAFYQQTPIATS